MPAPTATIFVPYHALDELHLRGTRAAQPPASAVVPGTLYAVIDEANALERSNGTAWEAYAPTGGGGGSLPTLLAEELLGRGSTSGAGPPEAITLGAGLVMEGTSLRALVNSSTSFAYRFSTATVAPPASQYIRFNAAHPYTGVTLVWASGITDAGVDVRQILLLMSIGSVILVQDAADSSMYGTFDLIGTPVDFTTYVQLPVAWRSNGAAIANNASVVMGVIAGRTASHHQTHEPGGNDVLVLSAESRLYGRGAGALSGPMQEISLGNNLTMSGTVLSGTGASSAHHTTHEPGGSDPMAVDAAAGTGSLRTLGTSATSAAAGNDARLSDARTPTAHATTHKSGGSDPIALDTLAAPTDITTLNASASAHGLLPKLSGSATQFLNGAGAWTTPAGGGTGDVTGPASASADNLASYNGTTGKIIKDSGVPTAQVARKDQENYFLAKQTLQAASPTLDLCDTTPPVDARYFRIINSAQVLDVRAVSDAGVTQTTPLTLYRNGNAVIGSTLLVNGDATVNGTALAQNNLLATGHIKSAACIRAEGARGSPPGSGGGLEIFFQSGVGYLHCYDITAATYPQINCATTNFNIYQGTLSVSGNATINGDLLCKQPVYPGRLDAGWTVQQSWYLASHGSYGLYSNTGLYLGYHLWCNAVEGRATIRAGTQFYELGRSQPLGDWVAYTPSFSGGTLGTVYGAAYMVVGHTMIVNLYCTCTAGGGSFIMYIPGGASTPTHQACHFLWSTSFGMAQTTPGANYFNFYTSINGGSIPAGSHTIGGLFIIQIQ